MRRWEQAALSAGALLAAVSSARGTDRFDVVPEVFTQSPAVFRDLFRRGCRGTIRALMIGDSQENSPGGSGHVYVPRWNAVLFAHYGNAPETPVAQMLSSTGGGVVWGDWLLGTALSSGGPTASRVDPAILPPAFSACKVSANNGHNVNNDQWYGQLVGLKHRGDLCAPSSMIAGLSTYFRRGQGVLVDVFAIGHDESGEVRVDAKPWGDARNRYAVPIVRTEATAMGLAGAPGQVRRQRLGPFPFAGRAYMQVELSGTDPALFTDVIGARMVSTVDARGWVVQSIAAGGYTSASLLDRHAECGAVLAALQPDVAILAYGANDAGAGRGLTIEEYRENLRRLIAFLREKLGATLPIILIADPWRTLDTPAKRDALDRYPGVCFEIAMDDPWTCALNSRRLLDDLGWNERGSSLFLTDGVHYTPDGAIVKARAEVSRLLAEFATPCCIVDLDDGTATGTRDGGVTIDDLLFFLTAYANSDARADVDDGTGTGTPDDGVTIDDLLYYLLRFESGC